MNMNNIWIFLKWHSWTAIVAGAPLSLDVLPFVAARTVNLQPGRQWAGELVVTHVNFDSQLQPHVGRYASIQNDLKREIIGRDFKATPILSAPNGVDWHWCPATSTWVAQTLLQRAIHRLSFSLSPFLSINRNELKSQLLWKLSIAGYLTPLGPIPPWNIYELHCLSFYAGKGKSVHCSTFHSPNFFIYISIP